MGNLPFFDETSGAERAWRKGVAKVGKPGRRYPKTPLCRGTEGPTRQRGVCDETNARRNRKYAIIKCTQIKSKERYSLS